MKEATTCRVLAAIVFVSLLAGCPRGGTSDLSAKDPYIVAQRFVAAVSVVGHAIDVGNADSFEEQYTAAETDEEKQQIEERHDKVNKVVRELREHTFRAESIIDLLRADPEHPRWLEWLDTALGLLQTLLDDASQLGIEVPGWAKEVIALGKNLWGKS